MSRFHFISVVLVGFAFYFQCAHSGWAKCWKGKRGRNIEFGCYGVSKLGDLDKAPSNINSILYHTSVLPNIEGNVFYRFRKSLMYLDIHKSGIETVDSRAFNGLTNLKNLTLWGNKLTWVPAAWFTDLTQLRTLDLSFNSISYIEETAFYLIPNLQNLYLDYNRLVDLNWYVFKYLPKLKRARLGRNVWDWWFRAMISRQLDDQHVDYSSEWDNYDWINHRIWNCVEKYQAKNDDDTILDCVSMYLLEEQSKIANSVQIVTQCQVEAQEVYDCSMRSDPFKNVTITPAIGVRKIFQGLIGAFKSLLNPDAKFS